MAQQSLGDREGYMVRVPKDVRAKELAAKAGYSSVSRWAADLFCEQAGELDLKVGPDLNIHQEELPIGA